jgi:hypothetical protein
VPRRDAAGDPGRLDLRLAATSRWAIVPSGTSAARDGGLPAHPRTAAAFPTQATDAHAPPGPTVGAAALLGLWEAGGETPDWPEGERFAAHHALVHGDRAYLGFDDANMVVLDVSDWRQHRDHPPLDRVDEAHQPLGRLRPVLRLLVCHGHDAERRQRQARVRRAAVPR